LAVDFFHRSLVTGGRVAAASDGHGREFTIRLPTFPDAAVPKAKLS
jgi:hypothetical protein